MEWIISIRSLLLGNVQSLNLTSLLSISFSQVFSLNRYILPSTSSICFSLSSSISQTGRNLGRTAERDQCRSSQQPKACSCLCVVRSRRSWYPHRLRHTWEPVKKRASLLVIRRWRAAAAEILLHGFPEASKNSVIYPVKDIIYGQTLLKRSLLAPRSSSGSDLTSNDHPLFYTQLFFTWFCIYRPRNSLDTIEIKSTKRCPIENTYRFLSLMSKTIDVQFVCFCSEQGEQR